MGDVVLYIALCAALPLALLCFYLEKRARRVMLSVLFGAVANLIAFLINDSVLANLDVEPWVLDCVLIPVVEEILKAIPVAIIVLGFKKGVRGCIANAFSVGVGFCIVENFFYLFEYISEASVGWVIARCVSTGLMHSMSAVLIGLQILYTRNHRRLKGLGILLAVITAIVYHGVYNLMVEASSLLVMIIGAIIPAITFTVVLILIKSGKYLKYLSPEESE